MKCEKHQWDGMNISPEWEGGCPSCYSNLNKPEPLPLVIEEGPAIWDLVVEDIKERDKLGTNKYGTRLKANDGRRSLVDAYQEALDLVVYLRKEIEERKKEENPGMFKEHQVITLHQSWADLPVGASGTIVWVYPDKDDLLDVEFDTTTGPVVLTISPHNLRELIR